jgi:stage II sporulation protein D
VVRLVPLILALALALALAAPAPAAPAPVVRVLIYSGSGPVLISGAEGVEVSGPGEPARQAASLQVPFDLPAQVAGLEALDVRPAGPWTLRSKKGPILVGDRPYRGWLVVHQDGARALVVNHLPLEDYLRGVVPLELLSSSAEAVRAQAVVARTYALAQVQQGRPLYDLVAGSRHQEYGGQAVENPLSDQAVAATAGLVLSYQGRLAAQLMYHSTCGGQTESNEEVFSSSPVPYLRGVSCGFCTGSRYYRWEGFWTPEQMAEDLARFLGQPFPPVERLEILELSPSGRVRRLLIEGGGRRLEVRGEQIRALLRLRSEGQPPRALLSTRFNLFPERQQGVIVGFRARGSGWGHGVGMCQFGAIGLARQGKTFQEILGHYYPGCEVIEAGALRPPATL